MGSCWAASAHWTWLRACASHGVLCERDEANDSHLRIREARPDAPVETFADSLVSLISLAATFIA